ncbi:hypothetical protein JR316_0005388 [Psilocybe cubensis]|uniref:Uncharacterized protein n=2 Tax=Psilocybe cubensis TaxID=181762 RepID=A0A8H7XJ02_PSICU|nr:hypothetical protein JR316_0005388 [Psilocybe cubensis]KAH9483282.1 hypothetical protein JR316_0005388 [Psilocybe cubensis]
MSEACSSKEQVDFIPEALSELEHSIHEIIRREESIRSAERRVKERRQPEDAFVSSVGTMLATHGSRHLHEQTRSPLNTAVPNNTPFVTPLHSVPQSLSMMVAAQKQSASGARPARGFPTRSSSCNLSILSDSSADDEECNLSSLSYLDNLLPSPSVAPQVYSKPSQNAGLGIIGITRKNDDAPFDGLGIVGINSPSRKSSLKSDAASNACELYGKFAGHSIIADESSGSLSDTFLQEVLLTFMEDPFHSRSGSPIPDCKSWYDLESTAALQKQPVDFLSEHPATHPSARYHRSCHRTLTNQPKLTKHFSSATISSELKRIDKGKASVAHIPPSRTRSTSWPTTGKIGYRDGHPAAFTSRSAWRN